MLRIGPVTPMDALLKARCMRLASRIDELRKHGYQIHTKMIEVGDKKYAEYNLIGKQ